MKFGFIAHPTSPGLKQHVKMVDMLERLIAERADEAPAAPWRWRNLVPFMDFGRIVAAGGAQCEGIVHYMPLTAEDMLARPREITQRVIDGVDALKASGAELVGLGGFTGIIGNRGLLTLERASAPVTTGNSLTAYAAWRNLLRAMTALGTTPAGQRVAIVGYPGSIALAVARLLARQGCELWLVHRGAAQPGLLAHLPDAAPGQLRLVEGIEPCYAEVRFYLAATSSGGVIDPARLLPGSVVIDAALPKDVLPQASPRDDVLLVDGGLISAGAQVRLGCESLGLSPKRFLNGCLAETLILALAGRAEAFSIGRELPPDKVLEIGELAESLGFSAHAMLARGQSVDEDDFAPLRRHHRAAPTVEAGGLRARDEVLRLFGQHLNPVLREFYQFNQLERVFVQGQGCWLTEQGGRRYLDFVAGYGCLNTGHNHPLVKARMLEYLAADWPTFVQYVSAPYHATLLAERLCARAPGQMERVFFSNSGTEAVEAGLKLAMAASARSRIVYCHNGYHGKTLGALSVTGRHKHRAPFEPLLPRCQAIEYGDLAALEAELRAGDVAAFIVEPIQGEGGVRMPPPAYLTGVRALCDAYDCLLILDEIQTGLGRTGKWFCCEWDNVAPDILLLAKSLSAGLAPIGATLCSAKLWARAYGGIDRFALHTSTFGGNNLAAAAALAALDVLEQERLPERAADIGAWLHAELLALAARYPFMREVRGRGLMLAIEFHYPFDGAVDAFADEFANRMPGQPRQVWRMLPERVRTQLREAASELENSLEDMFIMRVVRKLSQEHGVLTFVTANSNKVMRIQPPLTLSREEAALFVTALAQVCEDMSTLMA